MNNQATPRRRSPLSVGWGLIGTSRIAEQAMVDAIRHQPALSEATDIVPSWAMAVYSHSDHRAREFARRMQVPYFFDSLDQMWQRPEIKCVYISSQPRYQREQALAAIEAGKHVLCETPLALTSEDVRHVLGSAKAHDVLLGVNYPLRAHPALLRCATLIREYAIGDILGARISNCDPLPFSQQTWRLRPNGGGVLVDRTLHDIDLIRWLLADEIAQVSAVNGSAFLAAEESVYDAEEDSGAKLAPVEQEILCVLRMRRSGVSVQIHDSFSTLHQHSLVEIYGTGGTLIAYRWWGDWRNSELILVRNDEITDLTIGKTSPYQGIVTAFNDAVRRDDRTLTRRSLLTSGEDVLYNMRILEAIRASMQYGRVVPLMASGLPTG